MPLDALALSRADPTQVPWAPLPGESPAEYLAFQLYLNSVEPGQSRPAVASPLGRLNRWPERAAAHDAYVGGGQTQALDARYTRRRHLATLAVVSEILRTELLKHYEICLSSSAPSTDLPALVKMVKALVESERLLRDGDGRDQGAENVDLTGLADDELLYIEQAIARGKKS